MRRILLLITEIGFLILQTDCSIRIFWIRLTYWLEITKKIDKFISNNWISIKINFGILFHLKSFILDNKEKVKNKLREKITEKIFTEK